MSAEQRKAQRAEQLLAEAQQMINKGESSLVLISMQLQKRQLTNVREAADTLSFAARNLKRIAKRLEPANGKCSTTCPELCPNHQQLKISRGGGGVSREAA